MAAFPTSVKCRFSSVGNFSNVLLTKSRVSNTNKKIKRERGEMSEQDIPSPAEKLNQQKHFKKEKKRLFKLHLGPQPVFELPFISF
jgi:hypothetical protein